MAGECAVPEGRDLEEMGEEDLWELINDNRHRISLGVRPGILIPYLRQARVLTEMDEDEIVSCHNLTNRSMRTSKVSNISLVGSWLFKSEMSRFSLPFVYCAVKGGLLSVRFYEFICFNGCLKQCHDWKGSRSSKQI